MKKSVLIGLLLAGWLWAWVPARADLLTALLSDSLVPRTMTVAEQDSVLNGAPEARFRLVKENEVTLFRRSRMADYYLEDTQKKTRIPIGEGKIRDAVLSSNGRYVVYGKADNNLYIYKVDFKTEVAITTDGSVRTYNGLADWLYEEEFGITGMFAISPDSKQVAFVRLDETDVPVFEWQNMLRPMVLGEAASYPTLDSLRYPRAGEPNARAQVCVYDIHYKSIHSMSLPEMNDAYIPRIKWGVLREVDAKTKEQQAPLYVQRLNRDQTHMEIWTGNTKSMVGRLLYEEKSETCYEDYELFDQWLFLSNGKMIALSEKDGFYRAYMLSAQGTEEAVLTPQNRDVTALYGYDEDRQVLYYQAAPTPQTRQVYSYAVKKKQTVCLTQGEGTHSARFSKDYGRYIDCFESISVPHRYTLYTVGKSEGKVVRDNRVVQARWEKYGLNPMEFFSMVTERGDTLNAWRIVPPGFDASKKYPVLMMQYSGPNSQRVLNRWRKKFEQYVAQQGWIVVCADGRGTGGRGRAWRNETYMQLGRKEAEDQMSVGRYLQGLPYVDADRIGICGWSYGGYETLMCLSLQPKDRPVWNFGVGVAPVTDWRLYDSAYTERFMRRPQVNEDGYLGASAIALAGELQGRLLLIHGLADDNVHAQHSLMYVEALVKAGKQADWQFYPDDNHFLRNRANAEHVHRRIYQFINL